jgi:hypothetical protein
MSYIGYKPADKPLTSADITDSIITSAKIVDGTIVNADINASAAIATTKFGAGAVLQVVNVTYSTTTSSSSSTYADTGLTASITPSSASNKILILVNHNGCRKDTNNTTLMVNLVRGATQISGIEGAGGNTGSVATNVFGGIGITYLDSPATTSSTTYKTQFKSGGNNATVYINDVNSGGSTQSTMTLMEIAV